MSDVELEDFIRKFFEKQERSYKDSVLPPEVTARVAIETGATAGWYQYVGTQGAVIGMDRFGESAPANELFEFFGFTVEKVVAAANKVMA